MPATLTSLPSEIHLDILDLLDFHSLKNIRQTNQLYRCLVTRDRIVKALKAYKCELRDDWRRGIGLPRHLNVPAIRRFYSFSTTRSWFAQYAVSGSSMASVPRAEAGPDQAQVRDDQLQSRARES